MSYAKEIPVKKVFIVIVIAALVAAFFLLDGPKYLSLEGIKQQLVTLETWRDKSFLGLAVGFFVIYVVVTALSFPGAAVLTLAAGAIFGLAWGLLVVNLSKLGAGIYIHSGTRQHANLAHPVKGGCFNRRQAHQ